MTAPDPAPGQPRYYRSFVSYQIPFRPSEPITFEESEGLVSYYIAHHDEAGRVVRFDKIQLVRAVKGTRACPLPTPIAPGAVVYFAATAGGPAGDPLEYGETEGLDEIFAGEVGPDGMTVNATLLRRERAFSDAYDYWPDGALKRRTMTKLGQPPAVTEHPSGRAQVGATTAREVEPV